MQQTVRVAFLRREAAILVPGANKPVPRALSQRHLFMALAISIEGLLNRRSHIARTGFTRQRVCAVIQHRLIRK